MVNDLNAPSKKLLWVHRLLALLWLAYVWMAVRLSLESLAFECPSQGPKVCEGKFTVGGLGYFDVYALIPSTLLYIGVLITHFRSRSRVPWYSPVLFAVCWTLASVTAWWAKSHFELYWAYIGVIRF